MQLIDKINLELQCSNNIIKKFFLLTHLKKLIKQILKYPKKQIQLSPNNQVQLSPNNSKKKGNIYNSYGYTEDEELQRFFQNASLVKKKDNSGLFFDRITYSINQTERLINLNKDIKKVISIGCSYAYYESIIAQKYSNIHVQCFDRSKKVAILNKKEFPFSNIKFCHGDILNFLSKQNDELSIFNHMWIMTYLPKDQVEEIYFNLSKTNNKYIILVEPIGACQETGEMYKFSFKDSPSVIYRKNIFIHNYPGILNKYNYSLESCELIKTTNDRNNFLLKIILKKKKKFLKKTYLLNKQKH